jgi:hypothetical protein
MRLFFAATLTFSIAAIATAHGKAGTTVELAGMKSTTPDDWKDVPLPPGSMRMMQFKIPKADGDPEDAELAIFGLVGGGSVDANLERQEKKFELPPGKKDAVKVEKIKVGKYEAKYQDITGAYLKKAAPFDPNSKVTKMPDFRQLYVIFEAPEGNATRLYSMYLIGPAKTVEKHKKAFDDWLKNFK